MVRGQWHLGTYVYEQMFMDTCLLELKLSAVRKGPFGPSGKSISFRPKVASA